MTKSFWQYVVTVKFDRQDFINFLGLLENVNVIIQTWKFCNHIGFFAVIRSRSKSREIFWSIIDQAWSQWGEIISVWAFSIIVKFVTSKYSYFVWISHEVIFCENTDKNALSKIVLPSVLYGAFELQRCPHRNGFIYILKSILVIFEN